MKKPSQLQEPVRSKNDLARLAKRASYLGSPEHKEKRWWGGLPELRRDKDGNPKRPKKQKTTPCPLVTESDRKRATLWVREAIKNGQCNFTEGDKEFPKHIWHTAAGEKWQGLLVNPGNGEYKGWPLEEDE